MEKVCFIDEYGDLRLKNGISIREPALLLLPEEDMLIKYGEFDNLQAYLTRITEKARDSGGDLGIMDPSKIILIGLGSIDKPVTCYLINRMATSGSGFVKQFCDKLLNENIQDWLKAEMDRVQN